MHDDHIFPLRSMADIPVPDPPRHGATWGNWRYDRPEVLTYIGPFPGGYEVDLDEARTADEVGDWVLHLAGKTWVTSADLGDLVRAVRAIRHIRY